MHNEGNTDSKNQHYVPKFYLRNFSVDNNQKEIRLFNLKSKKFVATASIKHQASSNFYYGKDGKVEKQLSDLEGILAKAIAETLRTLERPKYFSERHVELLTFMVSTELRNPVRKRTYEQMTDGMMKKLLSVDPKFKDKPELLQILDTIEIIPKYSSTYSLSYLQHVVEITLDLHIKLFVNKTSIPFITSDNPVIRYNQLLEMKSSSNSVTGFGLQGLEIFIPLSENVLLLFYDSQPYYVGSKKQKKVTLDRAEDVDQLNLLQMANCYSNVYGGNRFSKSYVTELHERTRMLPAFHQVHQNTIPSPYRKNGEIVTHTIDSVKTNLILSFIYLSTFGSRFPYIGNKIAMRKHAEMVRGYQGIEREIKQKK
jgi:hypothetical protein